MEPDEKQFELLPIIGFAELPAPSEGLPAEMKKAIAEHLSANKETLELLHNAASIERCRYPFDLTQGFEALLRPLEVLRDGARLLSLEAFMHAENGEPHDACGSLRSLMALARSLENEPLLISQLVRIACQAIGVDSLQRIVSRTALPEAELQEIGAALARAEERDAMARAMAVERCIGWNAFNTTFDEYAEFVWGSPLQPFLYRAAGLLEIDYLTYLEIMGEPVRICEMPLRERTQAAREHGERLEEWLGSTPRFYCIVTKKVTPAIGRCVEEDVKVIARLRAARAALAVERYRLDKGRLPEELDELVAEYLQAIPEDPFDGKPLRYKKLDKGYVVYSIGPDGKDDDGVLDDPTYPYSPDVTFTVER